MGRASRPRQSTSFNNWVGPGGDRSADEKVLNRIPGAWQGPCGRRRRQLACAIAGRSHLGGALRLTAGQRRWMGLGPAAVERARLGSAYANRSANFAILT
jgi:hypothetical protein